MKTLEADKSSYVQRYILLENELSIANQKIEDLELSGAMEADEEESSRKEQELVDSEVRPVLYVLPSSKPCKVTRRM
jgi:hypothetical protein